MTQLSAERVVVDGWRPFDMVEPRGFAIAGASRSQLRVGLKHRFHSIDFSGGRSERTLSAMPVLPIANQLANKTTEVEEPSRSSIDER